MLEQIIAWAALLFSGIAIIVALRVQRQQPELIAKQIAELDRSNRERKEARVIAVLQRVGIRFLVQITNEGPAEARRVNLTFPNGDCPIPQDLVKRNLPIEVLQARGSVELVAAISNDCSPPFHVLLTWHDGRGDQAQESTLG